MSFIFGRNNFNLGVRSGKTRLSGVMDDRLMDQKLCLFGDHYICYYVNNLTILTMGLM